MTIKGLAEEDKMKYSNWFSYLNWKSDEIISENN